MGNTGRKGGQFGNNNAGKGRAATHALEMLVRWFDENGPDPIDWARMEKTESSKTLMRMWEPQVRNAMFDGNIQSMQMIVDRLDGRPRQAVDLGGQDDNPVKTQNTFNFVPVSRDK